MSTHNIGFYEEISKKKSLNYHQIHALSLLLSHFMGDDSNKCKVSMCND